MDPSFRAALERKGEVLMQKGETNKSIEMLEQYQKQTGDPLKGVTALGAVYALAGRTEEAELCLQKLRERERLEKDISLNLDQAGIYVALKDYEKAFYYLEKAFDDGVGVIFVRSHPLFKDMRNDPQYMKLMMKIGLKD